ncbi:MAG: hypothetical protein ACFFD2_11655 [Promethearchaeota archaeon]
MDFFGILNDDEKILERDIQFIYETHPYLIDPRFLNAKVTPQYSLPSGYADIVLFLNDEIIVIELKINPLIPQYVLQLNEYMKDLSKEFSSRSISGVLIGKSPKMDIDTLISNLNFPVEIKILKEDIPIKIKICKNCRLANPNKNEQCHFCSCTEWIKS